ncbi:sodium channel protein Nach [Bicyclus anynana]|uniref:Sodium channel protein Nach n=1 Tax=Bicyclus anynana TaxID=110368 RepID=A0ABM3LHP6_BICAN|nr:sodium channel protein Nach [Bicyclus anynana]
MLVNVLASIGYMCVISGRYKNDQIITRVHQTCEDLLIYCTFNRSPKNCNEMFNLIKTYDGHCCTFNYAALNEGNLDDITDDEDVEYYVDPSGIDLKTSGIVVTSESGRGSGLSVVFNVEPNDYPKWSLTPYHGAKILITDPTDYPEITVLYKYVIIGETLDIKVEPKIFQSDDDIRRMPVEKRACMFHEEAALVHTYRYSTETCKTECKMRNYADHCGCIPYKYPNDKASRVCDFEDLQCLNNLRAAKTGEEKTCDPVCYIECRDKKYSITSDVMPLLADFYPPNVTKGRNISELSSLRVYFAKSTCTCYDRMLLIDFNYFVATYGGVFSLSFGASIITLFELMYLLLSIVFKTLLRSLYKENKFNSVTNMLHHTVLAFKRFSKYCTLHGFYYYYSSSSWWVHIIWSIIIGSSVTLCVYLSHMIWGKFVDNPTFTVVESTHYPIDRISFPAVTVCDTEIIYGPNTSNITRILRHKSELEKYWY